MKGQAFVIYKDLNSATQAKHSLNDAVLFGKQIVFNKNKLENNLFQNYLRCCFKTKWKIFPKRPIEKRTLET